MGPRIARIVRRSATFKHRCPDGSERLVYRNVDDAFPLYVSGWKAGAASSVSEFMGSRLDLRAEYEKHIYGLLVSINDRNSSIAMDFRVAYNVYQTSPCTQDEFFARRIAIMLDEKTRIENLWLRLRALITLASVQP